MNTKIIISLLQNIAVLLTFTMLYDYLWLKGRQSFSIYKKIISGLLIGCITVILMMTPGILVPGISFDTRSIILPISGLFFGPIPTIIAMAIALIYRVFLGGDGVFMGIAVIISSGLIGILWRYFRPNWQNSKKILELLALGITVHIVMLSCTMLLPSSKIVSTISAISVPLVFIYIPGTVLIGWLMVRQNINWSNYLANKKLLESERRFADLLQSVNLLSIIIDKKGVVSFCNQYLLDITGYKSEEIIGKNWFDLVIRESFRKELEMVLNKIELTKHVVNEIITKDGVSLYISWSNTVFKNEAGEIIAIASIGENITKRKLAEENLIIAKEKAEESDKLKTIFLSNMSHEIRTPLNAIVGFSELIGDNSINPNEKTGFVEIINNSSTRLLQIINDIIDISKIEAKQLKIYSKECSLKDILFNTYDSFANSKLLKEKMHINLSVDFSEHLKDVVFQSDPNRIQQVLDNLISNAIKYTEKGEIEFGVSTKAINGIPFLEFYVRDTGFGIDEDKYELIFERFRQIEEQSYHQGAGIGLSICKGMVELLGGEIWLTSTVGKGSTFYFTLPFIITEIEELEKQKVNLNSVNLMNKTVIIAEDDKNSYVYLKALLKGHEMNIKHAENGEILMEMLDLEIPDLILLDINMPRKNGFECLLEMKSKGIKTKIIAQTAFASYDDKTKCLMNGCNDYISKPINKQEFYQVMNKVMSD